MKNWRKPEILMLNVTDTNNYYSSNPNFDCDKVAISDEKGNHLGWGYPAGPNKELS